jgi:hypothetical protein
VGDTSAMLRRSLKGRRRKNKYNKYVIRSHARVPWCPCPAVLCPVVHYLLSLTGILLRNLSRFPRWKLGNRMTEPPCKLGTLKIWTNSCSWEPGPWLPRTYGAGQSGNKRILFPYDLTCRLFLPPMYWLQF